MTFGEKLSRERKQKNYTQEQLADILGVSRQSISKWESDIAYPETDKLIKLGNLFNCSMDYFLKDDVENKVSENAVTNEKSAYVEVKKKISTSKIVGAIILTAGLLGIFIGIINILIFGAPVLVGLGIWLALNGVLLLTIKKHTMIWLLIINISCLLITAVFISIFTIKHDASVNVIYNDYEDGVTSVLTE